MSEPEKKPVYKPEGKQLICSAGRPLFEQGTPAHQAFYIESGKVEVTVRQGPHTIRVAELGPGEIFGEMGILEDQSRMASVNALEESVITVISRKDMEARIDAIDDDFVRALIKSLSHRIRQSTQEQVRYYTDLISFQDRMSGLMKKADEGIDQSKREAFANEAIPLLDQLEALLDKYRD
jgi:CRP-like cAMP-binding protein